MLKLHSETITHKTDVGGVQLNLADAEAVRGAFRAIEAVGRARRPAPGTSRASPCSRWSQLDGYELIVGSSLDPQFGPVLLFGTGGQLVEVFKDRALALPPLNTTLARRMMEQTQIYTALKGVRGRKPVDLAALEQLLVRFSQLVVEQPWIKEIDINPLLAVARAAARARRPRRSLHGPRRRETELPKAGDPPLSRAVRRAAGPPTTARDAHDPADPPRGRAAAWSQFHETLSERSVCAALLPRDEARARASRTSA